MIKFLFNISKKNSVCEFSCKTEQNFFHTTGLPQNQFICSNFHNQIRIHTSKEWSVRIFKNKYDRMSVMKPVHLEPIHLRRFSLSNSCSAFWKNIIKIKTKKKVGEFTWQIEQNYFNKIDLFRNQTLSDWCSTSQKKCNFRIFKNKSDKISVMKPVHLA